MTREFGSAHHAIRGSLPVHGVFRLTTQDVEVGGQTIPRGSMVWLIIGAANRDETEFDAASRFDPSRGKQSCLAFGHGPHFCLGAPLARLEACVGFEALAARFTGFERTRDDIRWNVVPTVRGPDALYVRALGG